MHFEENFMKSKFVLILLLTSSIAGKVFAERSSVGSTGSAVSNSLHAQQISANLDSDNAKAKLVNPNKYYLWIDKKKVAVSDHSHFEKLSESFKVLGLVEHGKKLEIDDSRLYDSSTVGLVKTKADELSNSRPDKRDQYNEAKEFIIKKHFANLYQQKGPFVTKMDSKIYKETSIENKDGRIVNTGRKGLINPEATANAKELYQALEECKLGRESLQKQMDDLRNDFSQQIGLKNKLLQIADLERDIGELEKLITEKKKALEQLDPTNALLKEQVLPVATAISSGSDDALFQSSMNPHNSPIQKNPIKSLDLSNTATQAKAVLTIQKNFRDHKVRKYEQQKALLQKDDLKIDDAIQLLLPNNTNAKDINGEHVLKAKEEKEKLKKNFIKESQVEKIENACKLIEAQVEINKLQGAPLSADLNSSSHSGKAAEINGNVDASFPVSQNDATKLNRASSSHIGGTDSNEETSELQQKDVSGVNLFSSSSSSTVGESKNKEAQKPVDGSL